LYRYKGVEAVNEWKYSGAIYLKDGMLLSNGFMRIVHGDRGDYVEIHPDQMCCDNLVIPPDQQWRVKNARAYYIEYRTKSSGGVMERHGGDIKVYFQKREVDYANYKSSMYYVSPMFLSCFEVRGKR